MTRTVLIVLLLNLLTACGSGSTKPNSSKAKAVNERQAISAPTLTETLKGQKGRTLEQRIASYNAARPESHHIECETKAPLGSRMKKTLCYFKRDREQNEKEADDVRRSINRPR